MDRLEVGAVANDGCINYIGSFDQILNLDPSDGDSLSLVGGGNDGDFVGVFMAEF